MNWLFAFLLLSTTTLLAQPTNPHVKWTATTQKTAPDSYTLTLTADIADGWYVYSQYLESEDGPIATAVTLEEGSAWSIEAPSKESGEVIKGYDELFGMTITKYKHKMVITIPLKTDQNPTAIKGYVTFMSCDDHQCLPPTDVDFEVRP